jgi:hypothetical protein
MRLLRHLRALATVPLLGAVLGLALWMPIPATGNPQLDNVVGEVHERLPGWRIVRANASWEGGYTVVAACGARQLGFQYVPEHGLPEGAAWIQPNDAYARNRLEYSSDHPEYLVWYPNPARERTLTCRSQLASNPAPGASSHSD